MVLEAVLEAVRQKMNAVPYLNRIPLNVGYGFYVYDSFNAPKYCAAFEKRPNFFCTDNALKNIL